ncbi:hypothetical protein D9757_012814 [Collybiopsis confluens]|uniref:Uncharacterized protein n=1 Tax=Collybiopsis confluens TaxID=2823264 RepID=A0A8H5DAE0_9AGAR|nr:hypothetical protein D9757_012814 [Collybiopsis confluens]
MELLVSNSTPTCILSSASISSLSIRDSSYRSRRCHSTSPPTPLGIGYRFRAAPALFPTTFSSVASTGAPGSTFKSMNRGKGPSSAQHGLKALYSLYRLSTLYTSLPPSTTIGSTVSASVPG